ncbi:hypothetical protein QR680_005555 [Steinernema hermaphroditum]|uniref:Uncharacterized protein n=1 Tax=Steinernema hermaphroditum TaxID=289476 RepID=A0AA39HUN6_9BILA|nr:hypothetical protein QR680_005555 [Steinernema hermaphroditum]
MALWDCVLKEAERVRLQKTNGSPITHEGRPWKPELINNHCPRRRRRRGSLQAPRKKCPQKTFFALNAWESFRRNVMGRNLPSWPSRGCGTSM